MITMLRVGALTVTKKISLIPSDEIRLKLYAKKARPSALIFVQRSIHYYFYRFT